MCCINSYIRNLKLNKYTFPFDWCITNPYVILDCLNNGFESYKKFGGNIQNNINTKEISNMLSHESRVKDLNNNIINSYSCFYPHHTHLNSIELSSIINRRINRFLDILNNNKKILFIFCNEHAIYRKDFRDKTKLYYEQLKEISHIFKVKYKLEHFKILFIIIDCKNSSADDFIDTDTIKVCKIIWDNNLLSDNEETHEMSCDIFRNKVQNYIKGFLNM